MFSIASVTFLVGLALIVVAVLGGGIEVREIRIPSLGKLARVASFTVGTIFLVLCVFSPRIFPDVAPLPGLAPSAATKAAEEAEAKAARDKAPRSAVEALGMELSSLTDETRRKFAINNTVASGVVVTHVDPGSATAITGIQAGAVIESIKVHDSDIPGRIWDPTDWRDVHDPADVAKIMQTLKSDGKKTVLLGVRYEGRWRSVSIDLSQGALSWTTNAISTGWSWTKGAVSKAWDWSTNLPTSQKE